MILQPSFLNFIHKFKRKQTISHFWIFYELEIIWLFAINFLSIILQLGVDSIIFSFTMISMLFYTNF